jgi:hypothetical protein
MVDCFIETYSYVHIKIQEHVFSSGKQQQQTAQGNKSQKNNAAVSIA